jgi:hypothetical protein
MMAPRPDSDRAAFAELMFALAAMYGRDLSRVQLDIYWRTIGGLDLEQLREAATRHAADPERGRFMPLPADFAAALYGTKPQRAAAALLATRQAAQRLGAYRSVVVDDPVTATTLRQLGGWEKVVAAIAHDAESFERRFLAMFSGLADNPAARIADGAQVLEGADARIARESGRTPPAPVAGHALALRSPRDAEPVAALAIEARA